MKTLPKFPLLKLQRNAKTFVFFVNFLAIDGKMADCCKELLVIVDKCKARLFCDFFWTENVVYFIACASRAILKST